jgi:hypothetical protein
VHAVALSGRARGSLPGRVETRAETLLPYVEWGLEDMSNFLLSVEPEVRVVLEIEGDVTALPDGSPD